MKPLERTASDSGRNARSLRLASGAAAISVGLLLALVAASCSSEPSESGKPLSYWVERLNDRDPHSRKAALGTIGLMGPTARSALPAIQTAIDDPEGSVGCEALMTYQIVSKDTLDWAPVLRALSQGPPLTRDCAAIALSKGGRRAVPELIKALADPDASVRADSARSLGGIGADAAPALPALLELRKDDHPDVVQAAGIASMLIRHPPPTPH